MPPVLLMTATIQPPADAVNLVRRDVALRMEDYRGALKYYIALLERGVLSHIVFAENSNVDIAPLREITGRCRSPERVEFIQFDGLDHPGAYGRAYGEFKLMDHAMRNSEVIAGLAALDEVWKVTGRYIVTNLAELLARRRGNPVLRVHCRDYPGPWADMYLMSWQPRFYAEHIQGLYHRLNEQETGVSERVFRRVVEGWAADHDVAQRLKPVPELRGVRGFDGTDYGEARLKRQIRRAVQTVAPWLWI
jgi:hypothetical protein